MLEILWWVKNCSSILFECFVILKCNLSFKCINANKRIWTAVLSYVIINKAKCHCGFVVVVYMLDKNLKMRCMNCLLLITDWNSFWSVRLSTAGFNIPFSECSAAAPRARRHVWQGAKCWSTCSQGKGSAEVCILFVVSGQRGKPNWVVFFSWILVAPHDLYYELSSKPYCNVVPSTPGKNENRTDTSVQFSCPLPPTLPASSAALPVQPFERALPAICIPVLWLKISL